MTPRAHWCARWVGALTIALLSCKSTDGGRVRRVALEKPARPKPTPRTTTAPAATPGASTCPADYPVVCPDGCCPPDTSCGASGGCEIAVPLVCPAEAPTLCEAIADPCSTRPCAAEDASGRANHALIEEPATFVEGRFGGAVSGGAAAAESCTGAMTMPTNGFPVGDNPFTIEAWVRTTARGLATVLRYGERFLALSTPGDSDSLLLFLDANYYVQSPIPLFDGRWHHVAVTYGDARGAFYVDGAELWSGALSRPGATSGVASEASIAPCSPVEVDELRILDYVASREQVARDSTTPVTPDSGTVGLWRFDEGPARAPGCCPEGTTCGADGNCLVPSLGAATCLPEAPLRCDGTCCPSGATCSAAGCLVPPEGSNCPVACGGTGLCCAAGETCSGRGNPECCRRIDGLCAGSPTPAFPPSCPSGQVICGSGCCSGAPCMGGLCLQSAPTQAICVSGLSCGGSCCPSNTVCGAAGTCVSGPAAAPGCPCRSGYRCGAAYGGLVVCQYTGTRPTRGGPQGPACGNGGFCEVTSVCTASATCCESSRPVGCGSACCLAGNTCAEGLCVCPEGETACGDVCCGSGVRCVEGRCEPACDADFPVECGESCCGSGFGCRDGDCVCPREQPVQCGTYCCLPDAPCQNGDCGCPAGTALCGEYCCPPGQVCRNGQCAEPAGGGGCLQVSLRSCFGSDVSGVCDCSPQPTDTCITGAEFTAATGLPLPSTCNSDPNVPCADTAGRLARPCCPGLSCVIGRACGADRVLTGGQGQCKVPP
jgi:hypothetical protein